jgi:DNA-binding CsgD family transcriptional regulator
LATVRTQVRGVLDKTGCSRQVEVVALLAGIAQTGMTSPSPPI